MFIPENFDDIDDNTRLEIIKNSKDIRCFHSLVILFIFFVIVGFTKYQNKSIWRKNNKYTQSTYFKNSIYQNKFKHNHQL